jgi:hypothetical protein
MSLKPSKGTGQKQISRRQIVIQASHTIYQNKIKGFKARFTSLRLTLTAMVTKLDKYPTTNGFPPSADGVFKS